MDVKKSFLNGNQMKCIGHNLKGLHPKIAVMYAKLSKSIYGLRQAYKSCNIHFNEAIIEYGFTKNTMNLMYTRRLVGA